MTEQSAETVAIRDDGPECDLCGKTTCPDADLPEFSEPRDCALLPVYNECGRDITKASIRIAARTLANLSLPPGRQQGGASS